MRADKKMKMGDGGIITRIFIGAGYYMSQLKQEQK